MRLRIFPVVMATAVAVIVTGAGVLARQSDPARRAFEAARKTEVVDRDLSGAITGYRNVILQYPSNRGVAADALLRLALVYDELGRPEAGDAYQRLIRDYADQPAAAAARGRMQAGGRRETLTKVADMVSSGFLSHVSANGRATFAGGPFPNELFLFDVSTGRSRPLTDKATDGSRNALESVIARDGSQAIYGSGSGQETCELRLVAIRGEVPQPSRTIYEGCAIGLLDWSSDGKTIAIERVQTDDRTVQLGLFSLEDRSVKVLKTLNWRGVNAAFFSPDGRDILYDVPASDTGSQRDVFILAADGSREVAVTTDPSHDTAAGWSSDGGYVFFASDRRGTRDLWRAAIANRRLQGAPELAMSNIGTAESMGAAANGSVYLTRHSGGADIEVAGVDLQAGRLTSAPTRPIRTYEGFNQDPSWSRDGKSLAYGRVWGGEKVLMIHSFESGRDREVPLNPALEYFQGPMWSPDGRSIAVIGGDLKGRHGVYRIEVATGAVALVSESKLGVTTRLTYEGPSWSADGQRLYYHRAGGQILEWDFATARERDVSPGRFGVISLSPDGRYIAAPEGPDPGSPVVLGGRKRAVIIPVTGGEPKGILDLAPGEWINNAAMTWTPDSRAVVIRKMLNDDGSRSELWLAPIDGGAPRKLDIDATKIATYAPGKIRLSPDGRQLAYYSAGSSKRELLVAQNITPPR